MILLDSAALSAADPQVLAQRREMAVGVAEGEVGAAALLCDWLIAGPRAHLQIGASADVYAALAWRIGRAAWRLYLDAPRTIAAAELVRHGIADALVPEGENAVDWARRWIGSRSPLALDTAAALIRSRGGEALERAAFSWLFAAGEPQEGLAAFLQKRPPRFRR